MGIRTAEIDAYIAGAQPFARPVLVKIRSLFHKACPEIEEKLKWGMPSFEYKGIVGGAAAFKKHVTFGFWKARLLNDPRGLLAGKQSGPMGSGKLTDISQLPPDAVVIDLIKQAVALNELGVKAHRKPSVKRPPPKVPPDIAAALKKNANAAATFKAFSPSHQREYVEWITQAKQNETRQRRLKQAIQWMAQGKPRNWKYVTC
jgi:uncharacterized protein YdeI (YjbR/CyaY-like superfamily)